MDKCTCYFEYGDKSECWGTKERELCDCDGDETKCDFYQEKRAAAQARKVTKEFQQSKAYKFMWDELKLRIETDFKCFLYDRMGFTEQSISRALFNKEMINTMEAIEDKYNV